MSINLLPWRLQQQKQQRKHLFMALIITAVSLAIATTTLHIFLETQIKQLKKQKFFLEQQLTHLTEEKTTP